MTNKATTKTYTRTGWRRSDEKHIDVLMIAAEDIEHLLFATKRTARIPYELTQPIKTRVTITITVEDA